MKALLMQSSPFLWACLLHEYSLNLQGIVPQRLMIVSRLDGVEILREPDENHFQFIQSHAACKQCTGEVHIKYLNVINTTESSQMDKLQISSL